MLSFITNLLNQHSPKKENNKIIINKQEIEKKFFDQRLKENIYLSKEKKEKIFKAYQNEINLSDNTQTIEEYEELFDKNKLKKLDPKNEFKAFCTSITIRINTEISVLKSKNSDIKQIELNTGLGNCSWCKELNNKILSIDKVLELVKSPKCTCRYSLTTLPIIEFNR